MKYSFFLQLGVQHINYEITTICTCGKLKKNTLNGYKKWQQHWNKMEYKKMSILQ